MGPWAETQEGLQVGVAQRWDWGVALHGRGLGEAGLEKG